MVQARFVWGLLWLAALPMMVRAAESRESKNTTSWIDRVRISGDFRYRHETISQEIFDSATSSSARGYDRSRHRIRLRLALQAKINERVDLQTRLATSAFSGGAGDPVSTNQDLSGGFTPKPIWLDRAYADVHPWKAISVRAGKQPVPFEQTELVWDTDLSLEGVALLASRKREGGELFVRAGGFWANERKPDSFKKHAVDQGLFAGQVGAGATRGKITAQLAVAYIDYGNVKNNPTLWDGSSGFGNRTDTSGHAPSTYYVNDYNLVNVNASVKLKLERIEPTVLLDFVTNRVAEKDPAYDKMLNTSWLAGLSVKFAWLPVDGDISYNYRVQQRDAVVAAFTDSDPAGGGTNYEGHKLALGVIVLPSTRLSFTYFKDARDPENKDSARHLAYDRVQGDFEVKF